MDFLPDDSESYVRPLDFLRIAARRKGLSDEDLKLPETALLVVIRQEFEALTAVLESEVSQAHSSVHVAEAGGTPLALIRSNMGAPALALVLEESIALGVRQVLLLGYCGSLDPRLRHGDLFVPTRAVREEGTSHHYLPGDQVVRSSSEIRGAARSAAERRGLAVREGHVWTTDAAYRETCGKIEAHRAAGVMAVEMETAALFAVAAYRGISAASLLVVSDELFEEEWRPMWFEPAFAEGCKAARRIAIDACRRVARAEAATEDQAS